MSWLVGAKAAGRLLGAILINVGVARRAACEVVSRTVVAGSRTNL